MVRDFTDAAKAELKRLVREVENEKWCDLTDYIGDRFLEFEEYVGWLSLKDDMSNVSSYHKKILDKNNTTLDEIDRIFDNVYSVEETYKNNLKSCVTAARAYNNILKKMNTIITPKGSAFTADEVKKILKGPIAELHDLVLDTDKAYKDVQKLLDNLRKKKYITKADKNQLIELFERNNLEIRDKVNKLLEKLDPDQAREIKFYIYSAKEPYRSIYLNQLETYTIGNIEEDPNTKKNETGFFSSDDNTINVDMDEEDKNIRGPYTTFFHESGHGIDYNKNDDGSFFCREYRDSSGRSLMDVIYSDVRNDIFNQVKNYTKDTDMQNKIMDYIMGAGKVDYNSLSSTEKSIVTAIKNHYRNDIGGKYDEAASDIYGGVTNNIIEGSYSHKKEYYWYDKKGEATCRQATELWAEFFSYQMTGNQAQLDSLKQHFPQAYEYMVEMANAMV